MPKPFFRKLLKIGGLLLAFLVVVLAGAFLYLYFQSPGKTTPITDASGRPLPRSIASLEPVTLNGTTQWLLMRGQDSTRPVLLFVHGGPGSPEMPMLTNTPELERRFVMVHWDQRGAGKSYDEGVFDASFVPETFVADAAVLSKRLAERFRQPKIYIMGHSWGTFLALKTVQRYPDLFHAYMGIGQVANQLEGERLSYDWVLQQARTHEDKSYISHLTRFGRPRRWSGDTWMEYLGPQRSMVIDYGGAMHRGNVLSTFAGSIINCPEYTVSDKLNYGLGAKKSLERLWPYVVSEDFNQTIPEVKVPVYIFQGRHDFQTPYAVAKAYFDRLKAPEKTFFTFEQSAHMVPFEEPERFNQCLDSVLAAQSQKALSALR